MTRLATVGVCQLIQDPTERVERLAQALRRFVWITLPFVLASLISAVLMAIGLAFRENALDEEGHVIDEYAMSLYNTIHMKEGIWTLMAILFVVIFVRRAQAQNLLEAGHVDDAESILLFLNRYLLPAMIFIGVGAVFVGVVLRNAY